jgi:hypothetical protein
MPAKHTHKAKYEEEIASWASMEHVREVSAFMRIVIMILYHRAAAKCQSLSCVERNGMPKVMSVFTLTLFESRS